MNDYGHIARLDSPPLNRMDPAFRDQTIPPGGSSFGETNGTLRFGIWRSAGQRKPACSLRHGAVVSSRHADRLKKVPVKIMRRTSHNATKADQSHLGGLTGGLTLAAMSLGFGVVQLDVTIVNTALNAISAGLHADVSALQWVVNAYTVGFAALILTAGALGDRVGAKRVFMVGFAVFTAASAACAFAPNLALLTTARAIQGFGAALLVPTSLALLNHTYRDAGQRSRAVGIWAAGASLALCAGPLAGGALVTLLGWRAIFLVNVPIGLVGLGLTWRYAQETPAKARRFDLAGQAVAIVALGVLAWAIVEGGKLGWTSPYVLMGFAAALALGGLFILRERCAAEPMLPLHLFARRPFSVTALAGLLVNTAFYGLIFVLSLYFQRLNGLSAFQTGLAFLPMMGMVLPVNLLAHRLSERIGARATIALGAGVAAVGATGLLLISKDMAYGLLVVQLMALGCGLGLVVPPLTATLLGSVDKAQSGIASGVLNSARQTGSVVGVALFGALVSGDHGFILGARIAVILSIAMFVSSAAIAFIGLRSSRFALKKPAQHR
jgi:DHA2 family methylenomycin A resistance protein-like MFS transporter